MLTLPVSVVWDGPVRRQFGARHHVQRESFKRVPSVLVTEVLVLEVSPEEVLPLYISVRERSDSVLPLHVEVVVGLLGAGGVPLGLGLTYSLTVHGHSTQHQHKPAVSGHLSVSLCPSRGVTVPAVSGHLPSMYFSAMRCDYTCTSPACLLPPTCPFCCSSRDSQANILQSRHTLAPTILNVLYLTTLNMDSSALMLQCH